MLLTDLIRVYDDALSAEFCSEIIAAFEEDTEGQFKRSDQQTWLELMITHNKNPAWRNIERRLLENMIEHLGKFTDGPITSILRLKASRAFEHLKIKKYRPDQDTPEEFPVHVDAYSAKTAVRIVAFLWYLNDVAQGGETEFAELGKTISPKAGRLAVFPPMWMYKHSGHPPASNDKYIITSYLNYSDPEVQYLFSYPMS